MTYQLRKTDQGLMLYGSEEVKPERGFLEPSYPLNRRVELYEASFKHICPIYKEHEEVFKQYALVLWRDNPPFLEHFTEALKEGIEIPSERVGFVTVDEAHNQRIVGTPIGIFKQYAILLTEKKEEEIIKTYTESDLRAAFGKGYARGYQQRDCEENYNPITGFEPKNKEATFEEFFKSLK
jgi:hypothetical protein